MCAMPVLVAMFCGSVPPAVLTSSDRAIALADKNPTTFAANPSPAWSATRVRLGANRFCGSPISHRAKAT